MVTEQIAKIVLTYNPENKINSSLGSQDFEATLDKTTGTLTFVVNMTAWKNPPSGLEPKIDELLNLVFLRALGAVDSQRSSIENALQTYVEVKIPVQFNFSFTDSAAFAQLTKQQQAAVIEKFVGAAKKLLISSEG